MKDFIVHIKTDCDHKIISANVRKARQLKTTFDKNPEMVEITVYGKIKGGYRLIFNENKRKIGFWKEPFFFFWQLDHSGLITNIYHFTLFLPFCHSIPFHPLHTIHFLPGQILRWAAFQLSYNRGRCQILRELHFTQ